MTVSRRPEDPEDREFLHRLTFERTAQELALDHLPEPMRSQILNMQVQLRMGVCRGNTSGASTEIILVDGQPAGWIYIRETPEAVHLVEIAVLTEYRGRGIGTAVIGEITEAAGSAGKPVHLRVNVMNTEAVRLYERLGFRRTGGDEVQHEMERSAD